MEVNVKLIDNAGKVLRQAWSVRLGIIAGLFSGAEVVVPMFAETIPRNAFAILSFATAMGAVVARFVAQPRIHDGD
jgi:hypothetical protein